MNPSDNRVASLMYVEPQFVFAVLDVIAETGGHICSVSTIQNDGAKGATYREVWFYSDYHNERIAQLARDKKQRKEDIVIHEFDPR